MKQILAGIVLLILLGIGGFIYRYEVQSAKIQGTPGATSGITSQSNGSEACTQDAKVCPDGSAVGRTGPNCSFAVCPLPNIELTSGSTTIGFVLPSGYKDHIVPNDSSNYIGSYIQSLGAAPSIIDVYNFPLANGQTPSQVMLAESYFDSSNSLATSTSEFKTITEGENTFYEIELGHTTNEVHSAYYLYEPTSVLRFDITENGVQSSASADPNSLPQHQALQQMLATLQISQ
jgi:hypothetical protein